MTVFISFTSILYRVNKKGKKKLYLACLNVDHAVPMLVCQCHTDSTSIHCLRFKINDVMHNKTNLVAQNHILIINDSENIYCFKCG